MSYIYDFLSELKFLDIIDFNEKFFDSFVEQNEFDVAAMGTPGVAVNVLYLANAIAQVNLNVSANANVSLNVNIISK